MSIVRTGLERIDTFPNLPLLDLHQLANNNWQQIEGRDSTKVLASEALNFLERAQEGRRIVVATVKEGTIRCDPFAIRAYYEVSNLLRDQGDDRMMVVNKAQDHFKALTGGDESNEENGQAAGLLVARLNDRYAFE